MGMHDWSMGFSLGELRMEHRWQEQRFGELSLGYYGGFWDLDTGEFLGDGSLSDWGNAAGVLLEAVRDIRYQELRLERTDRSAQGALDFILDLLDRNAQGEYLGQDKGRQSLPPRILADILGWNISRLNNLLEDAESQGLLHFGYGQVYARGSTNPMGEQPELSHHERLELQEWGRWVCRSCNSSGGHSDDPDLSVCDREQQARRMAQQMLQTFSRS